MRKVIPPVLAVALVACGTSPSEEQESSRCLQTSEFGNTGCAELAGIVIDPRGARLAQVFVGVRGPGEAGRPVVLTSGYVSTDSTGSYRLRAIRWQGVPPNEGPDTVTVWVLAAVPPPADAPSGTVGPMDSVLVMLELRPVGEAPVVTEVAPIAVPIP
jgi:hypothetical protein